ncbi:Polyadenylate-binding protein-interacting protein 9 [Rhynchospora pubera]|uniref:Polyadenylate-binding protein-interacting protein 9 n=1 Tax=Rhynchospora pubera TaxID=906938 RepID=A0AAV8DSX0_9POAL|nr:Polyadenylate-binding protein-interacting protein 9 [Rhynchospora pubera]
MVAAQKESVQNSEVNKLSDLLSKLNPSAKEFIPSSHGANKPIGKLSADAPSFVFPREFGYQFVVNGWNQEVVADGFMGFSKQNAKRRNRSPRAEREDSIRRTIYVSDVDHNVTEEKLAEVFSTCGQVVDCRICGDPRSILRFAFIEFSDEAGARAALNLGGTVLGYYPVRVLPSKTAILPVNPKFLPRSEDEKEMVVRTVYCTNIDKQVTEADVKYFFEPLCGEVSRLRLLGDSMHSTCIAFVEFVRAESAILALNCSGHILGTLPIRVSPSKTPVRPRMTRSSSH